MARTLKEAPLTTRNARAKLGEGLHWRGIDADTHLGYRKGKRGGVWLVRWRVAEGHYHRDKLGAADDAITEGTLDFNAAVRAARERVEAVRREERAKADGVVHSVRSAVLAYSEMRDARLRERTGSEALRTASSSALERYVTGREAGGNMEARDAAPIADVPLHELTEAQLSEWRDSLPLTLKASTRRHIAADLRAALNMAYRLHRTKLPASFPVTVTEGLHISRKASVEAGEATARENQILPDATVGEIIAAARDVDAAGNWGGDLYRMIVVLAATGARFSQIARLTVRDVQADRSRLMVPASRKGQGSKPEAIPVPIGADVLAALAPAIKGRGKGDLLLTRPKMVREPGQLKWVADGQRPWGMAARLVEPWAEIRKAARLADDVVPYALRHSSIVRGIRAGLPLRLVAALHDTSVAMIERHYGRWIADGLDDLAAAAVVPLVRG